MARGEEEQHTAIHHPRGRFARGGKAGVEVERKDENGNVKTERKMKSKVKGSGGNGDIKKLDGSTLEEVTELGLVTRRPGETRVMLTRGEADIVLGRDARTVVCLKKGTGSTIYIEGEYGDIQREMKITGKKVPEVEERIVKILSRKTYIKLKLSREELLSVLGMGGRNIERIQDNTGVYINTGKGLDKAKEINEVTVSGTPKAVASFQEFFNTGEVIKVTERQARVLMG